MLELTADCMPLNVLLFNPLAMHCTATRIPPMPTLIVSATSIVHLTWKWCAKFEHPASSLEPFAQAVALICSGLQYAMDHPDLLRICSEASFLAALMRPMRATALGRNDDAFSHASPLLHYMCMLLPTIPQTQDDPDDRSKL